jgi:hypothetical protein
MLEYVTTHDDPDAALTNWVIDGATRANTDHGRVYAKVGADVSLYRDAACTQLVASGALDGLVTLAEENDSGLSGSVRLASTAPLIATLDVFHADDDDLRALQTDIDKFLVNGQFAYRPGFADPLARAKRLVDSRMDDCLGKGWRADSLQPLADITARYALCYMYDYLSTRDGDAAGQRSRHWRERARAMAPAICLSFDGYPLRPFSVRVDRA